MCAPLLAAIPALFTGGAAAGGAAAAAGTAAAGAGAAAATTGITAAQVMTALSIATTGASLMAQQSAAKRANEYNQQTAEIEREEANARAEETLGETIREQREARARALVAAGESGAMGASLMASMNQSIQDQDMDAALAAKNVAFANRASDQRMATNWARGPSGLEAGLNLASAGVSGYSTGLDITSKKQGLS